ncbi:hypothetical protein Tco_1395673 [Tanacetum coccineum]
MTVTTTSSVLLLSDKLMTVNNLMILVPLKLVIDEMNYSSWVYFFKNMCRGFEVLTHILGPSTDEATSNPQTAKAAWDLIVEIFNENKRSRSISLKAELHSLKLREMT